MKTEHAPRSATRATSCAYNAFDAFDAFDVDALDAFDAFDVDALDAFDLNALNVDVLDAPLVDARCGASASIDAPSQAPEDDRPHLRQRGTSIHLWKNGHSMMLSPNRREGWVDPGTVGMPEMAGATAIERDHNPSYGIFPRSTSGKIVRQALEKLALDGPETNRKNAKNAKTRGPRRRFNFFSLGVSPWRPPRSWRLVSDYFLSSFTSSGTAVKRSPTRP